MLFKFLLTTALVYAALLAVLYVRQRSLMYFPDTSRPVPSAWGVSDSAVISVTTEDGLRLEGWYFPPAKNMPVILYFHGNASHHAGRMEKAKPYIDAGYGVLLAGYRGYGGNPGSPTEQGLYRDARAYVKFLADEKKTAPDQMIFYGESLGTGVAVQMAAEYSARALILESAYSSTADVAQATYFFVPVRLLMKDQYRSADKINSVKYPVLFVHGAQDSTIPIRFGQKLYDAANRPKEFVKLDAATHNDLYDHGAALHVMKFLSNIGGKS